MLAVNNINSINFNGKFRYLGAIPGKVEEIPFFEIGEKRVSKELVEFSKKSAFLNKLKEDRDVLLCHHREKNDDYVWVIFSFNKAETPKDTEMCAISMSLPVNRGKTGNLDKFEKVLENNSGIYALRTIANKLFPKDTHKVTPLPNSDGYCEFWTGKRTASDTLNKLFTIAKAEIKNTYNQINENIINKAFNSQN